MARHLARAIDYAVSSHYLMRTFEVKGADGDEFSEPNLEMRYSEVELLAKMELWKSIELDHVEPSEAAMEQMMAEKKTAEMKEIREDRPETKGVAKLVGTPAVAAAQKELPKAPAQAEAAKVEELPKSPAQAEAAKTRSCPKLLHKW